ncbi:hypothetical protein IHE44_0011997 [Lamprotornis superbus]|uniref:Poly [ADP-ribose] polymerase n=1 Tax=Lamprotornis superbus TaxID=245042 RepID=A0A835NW82_9PASS|nr:hypothetical protein IHE44_0011997 [Lamprotornis superbus]
MIFSCKYSHDIMNAENKKVLKKHDLSGLSENELQVLLLQNDPFFLPDTCQFYNTKGNRCMQQNNCNKLHVCRHFLKGSCKFPQCIMSHNLLDGHAMRVLETGGIDGKVASNFQAIYDFKHVEFNKEQKKVYGPSSTVPAQSQDQLPTGAGNKDKGPSSTVPAQSQDQLPTGAGDKDKGPSSTIPAQSQDQLPAGAGNKGKKDNSSDESSKDSKKDNCDEICLFYVWKYCKNKDKCKSVHYHLPYKWEIYDGLFWNELSMMEEIEKAYCDPKNSSLQSRNINFQTMTCSSSLVRRLSTPSSVTKPTFLLTTQWIWYWKNNQEKWVEYGEQEEGNSMTSPSSAIIENLYQADPSAIVPFQAGQHQYELNFKEMTQTNITFKTQRQVCRRPKFVSSEDVQKIKTGQKEKMKRENGGKEVQEKLLFHGTDITSMKTICTQNFDWRICGSNGTNYGKGSYFARDACYSHAYCRATLQGHLMFVARVLVGDYVKGNADYVRPPKKCADKLWFYDSCVDNELNPSVFVVFEKHQIYPEYIVEYKEETMYNGTKRDQLVSLKASGRTAVLRHRVHVLLTTCVGQGADNVPALPALPALRLCGKLLALPAEAGGKSYAMECTAAAFLISRSVIDISFYSSEYTHRMHKPNPSFLCDKQFGLGQLQKLLEMLNTLAAHQLVFKLYSATSGELKIFILYVIYHPEKIKRKVKQVARILADSELCSLGLQLAPLECLA